MAATATRASLAAWSAAALLVAAIASDPAGAQQQMVVPDYQLNAGDQLEVSVWKEPDLTKVVIVRPDGKFSFPLSGEVVAATRTAAQVQADISTRLKKFIPEPVVTVSVTGLEGNRIYVIGQVNKPGSFVMNPRFNVLQALTMAAGMTPFAATNDIIVMRGSGAAKKTLRFHYGDVSKGKNLNENVELEAGDVVIVP
jgi:polysaccharide export outer membrane protein